MNNYQWLLQMDGADRKAWFDAEHVETEERALDGDTAAPEAKIIYPMHHGYKGVKADMVIFDELHDEHDSREKLEADMREWWRVGLPGIQEKVENVINYNEAIKWLDRQAAITEQEVEHDIMLAGRMAVEVERERIAELTAERDELKEEIAKYEHDCGLLFDEKHKLTADAQKWADAANAQRLVAIEQADKVQELTAERDKLQEQLRIGWECECKLQAERERYREKFGKCLDYADAIHALMDDEGMA